MSESYTHHYVGVHYVNELLVPRELLITPTPDSKSPQCNNIGASRTQRHGGGVSDLRPFYECFNRIVSK